MLAKLGIVVKSVITFIVLIVLYGWMRYFVVRPALDAIGVPDFFLRDLIGIFVSIFIAAFIVGGLIGACFWTGQKLGWIAQDAKFWLDD